jgi:alpha-L-fucosidase 2
MIDGNLGFMSAIAEMLLQSQDGEIVLLPALPSKYPNGEVKGLRARNGFEVDIKWRNNQLGEALIYSDSGQDCRVRYDGRLVDIKLSLGNKKKLSKSDFL